MDILPLESLNEILRYLSVGYLVICRRTSKLWKKIIDQLIDRNQIVITESECVSSIIADGNIDILKKIISNLHCRTRNELHNMTAKHGQLLILKYLKKINLKHISKNDNVCNLAAQYNHIDILKWAYNHNYKISDDTFRYAIKNRNKEMIIWLRLVDCPTPENACTIAAEVNDFELLKWLRHHKYSFSYFTANAAIKNNNFEMLKWLIQNNCTEKTHQCVSTAEQIGNIEIFKWLIENGSTTKKVYIAGLIKHNDMDLIHWAIDHHCQININSCCEAIKYGYSEMLQWIIDNYESSINIKKNSNRLLQAIIQYDRIEILKWAFNTLPIKYDSKIVSEELMKYHRFDMSKWIYKNGHNIGYICENAAKYNHLEILIWCRKKSIFSTYWDKEVCRLAIEHKHFHILKWLIENGCPYDESSYTIYQLYRKTLA